VQIGITLIGIINGAYSGETFGVYAANSLRELNVPDRVAGPLGYGIVVAIITYLSVIIGELVPKSLALRNAEGIACLVAPIMSAFARLAAPAVWLLDASTRLIFRLLGLSSENEAKVTDEEIRALISEAETAGVIERDEHQLITGVMRLADRAVLGLMTPRTDVEWLDVAASPGDVKRILLATLHTRLPAGEGSPDALLGVVHTREVLAVLLGGQQLDLRALVHRAPIIPDTTTALDVLSVLREAEVPMALVHDEYGHFEGLVTPADILEAIAGAFKSDSDGAEPHAIERDDGSWLLSGSMPVDEMAEALGLSLPVRRAYQTVAGFVLSQFAYIPHVGEKVEANGWVFEIVDIDGRRIDKVLASRGPYTRRVPVN